MSKFAHTFAIPAHGDSPYLEECLRSLKQQALPAIVYITTSTPSLFLEQAAKQHNVPLIVNPRRQGMAADWTFAYEQCGTKYLTLAHQDDVYHPGYAAAVGAAAEQSPNTLIAFTDYEELAGEKKIAWSVNLTVKRAILALSYLGGMPLSAQFRKRRLLSWGCAIPCPGVMFNKRLIGEFVFSPEYQINIDWDAWARLAERPGSFCFVPRRLMIHRIHAGTATAAGIRRGRRQQEDLLMFRRFWPGPVAAVIARLYALSLLSRR